MQKNSKIRGFEVVSDAFRKHKDNEINLPLRASKNSAGYDFYSNQAGYMEAGECIVFWTDVKAYMQPGEVLEMYSRSSIGIKRGFILANSVGIIDMDYYSNEDNDGNIGVCLRNVTSHPQKIEKGERIAQGIFKTFLVSDNGNSEAERTGGIGSSGNK